MIRTLFSTPVRLLILLLLAVCLGQPAGRSGSGQIWPETVVHRVAQWPSGLLDSDWSTGIPFQTSKGQGGEFRQWPI